jgi:hypothetical protein
LHSVGDGDEHPRVKILIAILFSFPPLGLLLETFYAVSVRFIVLMIFLS